MDHSISIEGINYLKKKLSYNNQNLIKKQLNNIDVIFYFIFKPTSIKLELRNKSNKIIAKYDYQYEEGIDKDSFNNFMKQFYDRYFLSSSKISLINFKDKKVRVIINEKEISNTKKYSFVKGDTTIFSIYNIPKHANSWVQVIGNDNISDKHYFKSINFGLNRF